MSTYVFDRLGALESLFDRSSQRLLTDLGVSAGWRCLEVGCGAGGLARWLSKQVGDTGRVLAYAPLDLNEHDDFPSLYVRATEAGISRLVEVLQRLETGEIWQVQAPAPDSVYRSTISGWKLLGLEMRKLLQRSRQPIGADPPHETEKARTARY